MTTLSLLAGVLATALPAPGPVKLAHPGPVYSLAYAGDGKLVTGCKDGKVRVWDVSSRKVVHEWEAHKDGVFTLAPTRDGKSLLTGGADSHIRVWDFVSGKQKAALPGLRGNVEALAVSADGRFVLASTSGWKGHFRANDALRFT